MRERAANQRSLMRSRAAAFHIESFGKEAFGGQDDVVEAFVIEASLTPG